jgi:hypothetical protein
MQRGAPGSRQAGDRGHQKEKKKEKRKKKKNISWPVHTDGPTHAPRLAGGQSDL